MIRLAKTKATPPVAKPAAGMAAGLKNKAGRAPTKPMIVPIKVASPIVTRMGIVNTPRRTDILGLLKVPKLGLVLRKNNLVAKNSKISLRRVLALVNTSGYIKPTAIAWKT